MNIDRVMARADALCEVVAMLEDRIGDLHILADNATFGTVRQLRLAEADELERFLDKVNKMIEHKS